MNDKQDALVQLLLDFAGRVRLPDNDSVATALEIKAREIVGKISELAYAEAVEAIDADKQEDLGS